MNHIKKHGNKWLGLLLVVLSAFKAEIATFTPLFEPAFQAPLTAAVGIVMIGLSWWKDQDE